jgi:asparagine synthetase B (glutamine-hydrolysing)
MSGLLAVISREHANRQACDNLLETIDLSRTLRSERSLHEHRCFAVTYLDSAPVQGERLFDSDTWTVLFAGDVVERGDVPRRMVLENLENETPENLTELDGIFAIVAFDKRQGKLYVISDRRSQQPVYYHLNETGIFVSTDLSTFCRLRGSPPFNEQWLWEYLYFNYPTGGTTFLRGVYRVPAASIVEFSEESRECTIREYAPKFARKDDLIDGREALELAAGIFSERVPKYYEGADEVACALTGGWDGRTLLALAPHGDITAYTYGVPGCHDLEGGSRTARALGIKHLGIPFDHEFTTDLPHHMLETVYVSSGLQGVLRATLLYAYRKLTRLGHRFPLTISGLSMDMQFRGHACAPALISHDTVRHFETGDMTVRRDFWRHIIENGYPAF